MASIDLAGVVICEQDVPGSKVSVHKVLPGQVLHAQSHLAAECEQPVLHLWRDQLSRTAWEMDKICKTHQVKSIMYIHIII